MGFLHSFTTGSAVDGPGVRLVAWTAGCMWRCLYCHNPDTWTMTNGIPVTIARATEELSKYRHGLKVMSGGFTLSGGEALMQHRFAAKILAAARGLGIHTALDTNGYYGDRLSDAELGTIEAEAEAAAAEPAQDGIPLWWGWGPGPVLWPSQPVSGPSWVTRQNYPRN
jgi:pyruvate formate lyase activating enzyme